MAEGIEQAPVKKKSMVRTIMVMAGVAMAAVIVALLTYQFVLAPMLSTEKKPQVEQTGIGKGTVIVAFDQGQVQAVMPPEKQGQPASLVLFKVSFQCSNQATADLVMANQSWFTNMLRELHSGHQRDRLDDRLLLESIQRQVRVRANEILKQIPGGEKPANKVINVFHDEFYAYDQ